MNRQRVVAEGLAVARIFVDGVSVCCGRRNESDPRGETGPQGCCCVLRCTQGIPPGAAGRWCLITQRHFLREATVQACATCWTHRAGPALLVEASAGLALVGTCERRIALAVGTWTKVELVLACVGASGGGRA